MLFRLTMVTLAVISLHACAEFAPSPGFPPTGRNLEQCQSLDAHQKGINDGEAGKNNAINTISQQCMAHKVNVDTQGYLEGWQQGLQLYCVPSTAFDLGGQGEGFPDNCQIFENVDDLQDEYNRGYDVFIQISPINDQINAIDRQLNEADNIRNEIAQTESRIMLLQNNAAAWSAYSFQRGGIRSQHLYHNSYQRQEIQSQRLHLNSLNAELIANAASLNARDRGRLLSKKADLVKERGNLVKKLTS